MITRTIAVMTDVGLIIIADYFEPQAPHVLPSGIHELDALHFAQRGGLQYFLLIGTWHAEIPRSELSEILDGGREACSRRHCARVERPCATVPRRRVQWANEHHTPWALENVAEGSKAASGTAARGRQRT